MSEGYKMCLMLRRDYSKSYPFHSSIGCTYKASMVETQNFASLLYFNNCCGSIIPLLFLDAFISKTRIV